MSYRKYDSEYDLVAMRYVWAVENNKHRLAALLKHEMLEFDELMAKAGEK